MQYDDASSSQAMAGTTPDARDDLDAINAKDLGPIGGNVITGAGTITGTSGADVVADAPGRIVAVRGESGSDESAAGEGLNVEGRYGELNIENDGTYRYTRNSKTDEGVSDVFRYTLADQDGQRDTATLTIDIRRDVEERADAQQIIPTADGVVVLPAGVQLSDIRVVGRDLVILLPDGTQMVIPDGAVFVPQLVIGDVEVPPTNLAALLIDAEPQPASGTPQSSGGNFGVPVGPLDPGVPLGDLIPPTELVYVPPEFRDAGQLDDDEPEIFIQPDGQPAAVAAVDSVDERGLPARSGGEPQGSGEEAAAGPNGDTSETTTGVIIIDADDDPLTITITGAGAAVAITSVGQTIVGAHGVLTITSINLGAGTIGYSYTLTDNTSGDATRDDFSVTVEDRDGDTATATLRIDIVDDVPTARNDSDSIAAGQFGPATGNVITDAAPGDAGDSDTNAADTVGADNARVTFIDNNANAAAGVAVPGVGSVNIAGQYGTLTIFANGDYSYTRNPNTPGGVTETFGYTLTDGDGDTSTATLTISIANRPVTVVANPPVQLDDDALPGGNPGGTGDVSPDTANTSGTLSGSGGDGTLTFDLQTSGAPAGFSYVDGPGGSVLIQQNGVTVITVTLNSATGAYTVTQNAPILHPAGGNENDLSFTLNYTVADFDGDGASGTLTINVDDDTPIMTRADVSVPTLTVDETNLAVNATGNFSTLFTVAYGADGAGTTVYGVSVVNGTNSGLVDVATGQPILLFNNAGVVEGRVGGSGGAVAFTVSANSTTGVVTLDQVRAVTHPDASNPDDPVSPTATSIQFTVTATDRDGDPVSQTINIGGNFVFRDDGPDAQVNGQAPIDTLVLDETRPVGTETDGDSNPAGLATVQANFADNFVTPTNFGADGAGTVAYSLVLSGSNVGSGLFALDATDTSASDGDGIGRGAQIVLNQSGNTVTGSAGGIDYFTISIDPATGVVTFTQLQPIWHANTGSDDDTSTLSAAAGSLVVRQTITDRDGDSDSASLDVSSGVFQIEDDGPVAINDNDTLTGGATVATGNVITDASAGDAGDGDNGADDVGADVPGRITAISHATGGTDTSFSGGFLSVTGTHGTLQIDASGNYTYTRTSTTAGSFQDVFTYTLMDADGDTTTATLTIDISDNAPVLTAPPAAMLDDDDVVGANGNAGGPNDDAPANTSGTLVATGGDGDVDFFFAATQPGLPTGFSYNLVNASTMQILQGATVVLTITLNNETGAYSIVQNAPILHPTLDGLEGDNTENNVGPLNVNFVAIDENGTGDSSPPVTLAITVDDDTPVLTNVQAGAGVTLDETTAGTPAGFPISLTSATPAITATQAFGADGPAASGSVVYGVSLTGGVTSLASGLQTAIGDHAITLVQIDADTIQGQYNGTNVAFTIQMNANGTVTLTQNVPLEHVVDGPPGPAHDDALTLSGLVNATITITDKDGDSVTGTAAIGGNLVFEDDGPSAGISVAGLSISHDETVGNQTDANDVTGPLTVFAGVANPGDDPDISGAVIGYAVSTGAVAATGTTFGADGGSAAFSLAVSAQGVDSGLDLTDGTSIFLFKEGNLVVGRAGVDATAAATGPAAFAIAVDSATGQLSMVQYLSIKHPTGGASSPDESVSIANGAVLAVVTATDNDGDTSTASTAIGSLISFQDDAPRVTAASNININNGGDVAHTGTFQFDLGADGPPTNNDVITNVTFSATVNGNPTTLNNIAQVSEDANTAVFSFSFTYATGPSTTTTATGTITFNKAAGTYTVDLTNPISGFSVQSTSQGSAFIGYEPNTAIVDTSQPMVSVTTVRAESSPGAGDGLFVQFTGIAEPASGTGANNLFTQAYPKDTTPVNDGDPATFTAGELFAQDGAWVSTSNDANGVAGDTIQGGEVLDFNLYKSNPHGFLNQPATNQATAESIFFKLDGVGTAEDFIVILKLWNPTTNDYTTKAVMVENADIIKDDSLLTGTVYDSVVLDNNDGLVVIEANDYNMPGYFIIGAQIAGSDEDVAGTAVNLNGGIGVASTGTQPFSTDENGQPMKISDIGFVTVNTTQQTAQLTFNVTIQDGDGDTDSQTLVATVTSSPDSSTPVTVTNPPLSTMMVSQEAITDDTPMSLLSSNDNDLQLKSMNAANGNAMMLGAIAGAGLVHSSAAAAGSFSSSGVQNLGALDLSSATGSSVFTANAFDPSLSTVAPMLETAASFRDLSDLPSGGMSFQPAGGEHHSIAAPQVVDKAVLSELSQGTTLAAHEAPAAMAAFAAQPIAIPSADMLAGNNGGVAAEQSQSTQEVGRVLADALAGGGDGPNIEAMLSALPDHGGRGAEAVAGALASHGAGAVSGWDMGVSAGFAAAQAALSLADAMAVHQDAVPQA